MADVKLGSKGESWFCTTGLPSDVVITIGDMSYHLHKFPLMSKSRKIHQLITDRERNPRSRTEERSEEEEEEDEEELHRISLPNFPGGSEAFETAAKFCYGVKIELSSFNAAPLRCAAEYLGMSEDFAEENLASRCERFLAQSVLRNPRESARALKSCEDLMPIAEELGVVQRCIDSIAAAAANPSSILSWPLRSTAAAAAAATVADSWFEELAWLSLPIYKRVISAMKERDLSSEAIEGSLISYAKRSIPGISRSSRSHSSVPLASEEEQRELLETIITNLPLDVKKKKMKRGKGPMTARFLFGLLRTVNLLRASEASRTAVEKKIATQLEDATLDDLLIPSFSYLADTLYDVDCVERILGHYLGGLENGSAIFSDEVENEEEDGVRSPRGEGPPLVRVGKLVDGYLSEIASDSGLNPERFCALAMALPESARLYEDGLYRAVDVYLRAHPRITEAERERVSGAIDCRKLTLEACAHAAQNERLPLRVAVNVLSSGHLRLQRAVLTAAEAEDGDTLRSSAAAARENQVLRLDVDSVRGRVLDLERECSRLRRAIARLDRVELDRGGGWGERARRFGCRTMMRPCDTRDRSVVEHRRFRAARTA